jgi:cold shock protein
MPDDQVLKCTVCNTSFVWTHAEQALTPRPDCCPMCCRIAPAAGRQRGVIKWYSRAKGYGFITPVSGAEIFFHKSGLAAVDASPVAGQLVEYGVGRGPRGAQAEAVELLIPPAP